MDYQNTKTICSLLEKKKEKKASLLSFVPQDNIVTTFEVLTHKDKGCLS